MGDGGRFPFSQHALFRDFWAAETATQRKFVLDPPVALLVSEVRLRYQSAIQDVYVAGMALLLPQNSSAITAAVTEDSAVAVELTAALHAMLRGLAGVYYTSSWEVYDLQRLMSIGVRQDGDVRFPEDYTSISGILSRLTLTKVTSMTVSEQFRIGGMVLPGSRYASWPLATGYDQSRPDVYHRIAAASSLIGTISIARATGTHSEIVATVRNDWTGINQVLTPAYNLWSACEPVKVLDAEEGYALGKRTITFQLVKDAEFGYLVAARPSGLGSGTTYLSSSGNNSSSSSSSLDVQQSSDCSLADAVLRLDALNRVVLNPKTSVLTWRDVVKAGSPLPPATLPPTDDYHPPSYTEVPYRRASTTAFTLNGRQVPVFDRMTDITWLLKDGTNVLEIEYSGHYAWSDWWVLPVISVHGAANPAAVSWKCKCFKHLGRRHVRPRNDCTVEQVSITVESLRTNTALAIAEQHSVPTGYGVLSCRPLNIHHGQTAAAGMQVTVRGLQYTAHLEWFNVSTGSTVSIQVASGVQDQTTPLLQFQFQAPPYLPKDRNITLRVSYGGRSFSRALYSFGDRVCGDWRSSFGSRLIKDYCCWGTDPQSASSQSGSGSGHDFESGGSDWDGCVCDQAVLSFTTLNGLIEGSGASSIGLSDYLNIGKSCHTVWRLVEAAYGVTYLEGAVINGVLDGLPGSWSPPNYGYTGYLQLRLEC